MWLGLDSFGYNSLNGGLLGLYEYSYFCPQCYLVKQFTVYCATTLASDMTIVHKITFGAADRLSFHHLFIQQNYIQKPNQMSLTYYVSGWIRTKILIKINKNQIWSFLEMLMVYVCMLDTIYVHDDVFFENKAIHLPQV